MWACSRHSHSGVQHEVRERCFFCLHFFAPSPRSECLEQANLVCLKIPMFLNNSHTQKPRKEGHESRHIFSWWAVSLLLHPKATCSLKTLEEKKILLVEDNLKGKAAIGSLKNKTVSSKRPSLSDFFLWSELLLSLIKTGH